MTKKNQRECEIFTVITTLNPTILNRQIQYNNTCIIYVKEMDGAFCEVLYELFLFLRWTMERG